MTEISSDVLASREQLIQIIRLQTCIAQLGMDLGAVMSLMVERALLLVVADGAVIELAEKGDMVYRATSGVTSGLLGLRVKINGSLSGLCVITGKVMRCDDTQLDPRVDNKECSLLGIRSMLLLPLMHSELCVGVLKVVSTSPNGFTRVDESVLSLLVEVIASEIYFAAKYASNDLFYRATHDELTGLANRALFLDRMRNALNHTVTVNTPMAIIIIDMDGLKMINDKFGHRAGDEAIKEFSNRLRQAAGASDTVARIGGDEFAILIQPISGTTRNIVETEMKNLIDSACSPVMFEGNKFHISASAGFSISPVDGVEPGVLIEKADMSMYAAKRKKKE